ncbi:bifunctional isochorismate lyase/aryl carrier protein [Streptomyces sp. SLBN-118]|uniref:isochorismatase family protein n=1 Tax=Streptomyces sp. SLBN-118 TaxID=2768454 RepID=UPI0011537D01|nr:isochorismatase family protein [Streptomyces sp. SLBN-118]TQK44229.1 bifunctional isochorismate lyase/aryl carrier protein [Streptomyces sp. SLBN-118]
MAIAPIDSYPMPRPVDLPANTATWTVDTRRAVLLVHDMQHYFLAPFAGGKQPLTDLIAHTAALRESCAERGVPVLYTAQPGGMTPEERGLLQDFWGPGMSAAPEDRGIPDAIAPGEHDTVLTKWRASAFHKTGLLDLMSAQGRDQLIICGIYAHVGILLTACDAFAHNIQTFVVADAIADFTPEFHRMALQYAATRCAMTLPTATVLQSLATVTTASVGDS